MHISFCTKLQSPPSSESELDGGNKPLVASDDHPWWLAMLTYLHQVTEYPTLITNSAILTIWENRNKMPNLRLGSSIVGVAATSWSLIVLNNKWRNACTHRAIWKQHKRNLKKWKVNQYLRLREIESLSSQNSLSDPWRSFCFIKWISVVNWILVKNFLGDTAAG